VLINPKDPCLEFDTDPLGFIRTWGSGDGSKLEGAFFLPY
jgi:hypothetical protein